MLSVLSWQFLFLLLLLLFFFFDTLNISIPFFLACKAIYWWPYASSHIWPNIFLLLLLKFSLRPGFKSVWLLCVLDNIAWGWNFEVTYQLHHWTAIVSFRLGYPCLSPGLGCSIPSFPYIKILLCYLFPFWDSNDTYIISFDAIPLVSSFLFILFILCFSDCIITIDLSLRLLILSPVCSNLLLQLSINFFSVQSL